MLINVIDLQRFIFSFFTQFYVPFKVISAHRRWPNQYEGKKWEIPERNQLTHLQAALDLSCTCKADQRLCFPYMDSTMNLLSKSKNFQPLAIFFACTARFLLNLFGNHIVGFLMMRLNYFNITCMYYTWIIQRHLMRLRTT